MCLYMIRFNNWSNALETAENLIISYKLVSSARVFYACKQILEKLLFNLYTLPGHV